MRRTAHDPSAALPVASAPHFTGPLGGTCRFQQGKDLVIPQTLLLRRGGSHADQPSCDEMARSSPLSPTFRSAAASAAAPPLPSNPTPRTPALAALAAFASKASKASKAAAKAAPPPRTNLLWFGGHSGHGDARTALFRLHSGAPGFALLDTLKEPQRRLDASNMSLTSTYCWVPRGQGQGDPTRHMVFIRATHTHSLIAC